MTLFAAPRPRFAASCLAAHVGLVSFDHTREPCWSARSVASANRMRCSHEPGCLVGHPEVTVELVGADTLLAGHHQVSRIQPLVERNVAVLEDRPHGAAVLLPARAALVDPWTDGARGGRPARELVRHYRATARAYRAIRPADGLQVLPGGFGVGKTPAAAPRRSGSCCPLASPEDNLGPQVGFVKYTIAIFIVAPTDASARFDGASPSVVQPPASP